MDRDKYIEQRFVAAVRSGRVPPHPGEVWMLKDGRKMIVVSEDAATYAVRNIETGRNSTMLQYVFEGKLKSLVGVLTTPDGEAQ